MKTFLIGRYPLGYRMVSLFANPDGGGATCNLRDGDKEAQIVVGMAHTDTAETFGILCHEVWELIMDDLMVEFRPINAFVENASDCRWFFFNHQQHTEISARASYFVWECFADFKKAHAKCHARPKSKRKK